MVFSRISVAQTSSETVKVRVRSATRSHLSIMAADLSLGITARVPLGHIMTKAGLANANC
ncbi:MAG: hypothetical protein AB8Z16_00705 [Coxiella endosymbiont of Haemaphysalis qinghaiensis]